MELIDITSHNTPPLNQTAKKKIPTNNNPSTAFIAPVFSQAKNKKKLTIVEIGSRKNRFQPKKGSHVVDTYKLSKYVLIIRI